MRIVLDFATAPPPAPFLQSEPSLGRHWLAGGTVVGHILSELASADPQDIILLAGADGPALAAWIRSWDARLAVEVVPVSGAGVMAALGGVRPSLGEEAVLLAPGNLIVQADYALPVDVTADVICWGQNAAAGVCWFRGGADLCWAAEQAPPGAHLADLPLLLAEHGRVLERRKATFALDVSTVPGLLAANARLLALGRGSHDAIERSYLDDFTVIPPVFIHDTAEVSNSVIGPFANIEAGAVVSDSVLRNTMIGVAARVDQALLDGAAVGDGAQVQGRAQAVTAAAGAALQLDRDA